MKKIMVALVALFVLASVACSTGGSDHGGGTSALVASCSGQSWAVGDSITKGVLGVTGWPDQPPAAGHFENLGVPGAYARDLAPWTESKVAACAPGTGPQEVVFAAGINDLAYGISLDAMEAHIADFVSNVGVKVRLLTLQPFPAGSRWAYRDPTRRAYNAWLLATYPAIATDCSTPLEGPDGWLLPAYNEDGVVHLTEAGELALSTCVMAGE
jgi:hypothetical protein